ncbi:MAG: hypothetical protein VB081_01420 [Christensenella sp.]|uniref:hypothetical protein n=1 Tax=Christensenella sp. TaxID=1935934 RepID=UPI002B1F06BF|nr:hypothetical protein [Christensenella sp.]MEA5002150.1 hypothetical protein [Christensenella sp.]
MKKLTLVIVTVVLCAAMLMGCAAPATEATDSAAPSESAAASESAEGTESAVANADYMSWTGADWNAATNEEQFAATEAVLLEIGDAMMDNYTQLVEQAKTNDKVKAQIDTQIEALQGTIGTFFESSPEATLKELVDASKQAAAAMAE